MIIGTLPDQHQETRESRPKILGRQQLDEALSIEAASYTLIMPFEMQACALGTSRMSSLTTIGARRQAKLQKEGVGRTGNDALQTDKGARCCRTGSIDQEISRLRDPPHHRTPSKRLLIHAAASVQIPLIAGCRHSLRD
jgi:hypothetical protein